MQYLNSYLNKIIERGNVGLAESISATAEEVGNKYLKNFSFTSHEIGLLFGNVQSGKTGQMFGIMSKATDLGFPVFVLLTTDNVVLQQQTLDRVKADLEGFCICGENDARVFTENSLMLPTIVVLKKNSRILKLWANIFNSTGFMRGNPLFIVDDEADAASLNTLVNKNQQSAINKYLDSIRNGAASSLYLQVTGTPVSYTHLDVYKRQTVVCLPLASVTLIVILCFNAILTTSLSISPYPLHVTGKGNAPLFNLMKKIFKNYF